MFRTKSLIIVLIITILGAFLRLYGLESFPIQLNHDEVTQLYDAISIAETGKDIYGNSYPFIFKSVNDYKPPFYTYSTAVVYKFLGWRDLTIKIPAILFGILIIPAMFVFTNLLFKNRMVGIIASFFTAIVPFEIFYSRKGFESGAGIFFMIIGFSLLIYFLERSKPRVYLILSAIFFGIALYTYFSHVFIIPLVLLVFYFHYKKYFDKIERKSLFLSLIIGILVILPLVYLIFTNPEASNRTQAVFISQDTILGRLLEGTANNWFYKEFITIQYAFNRYLGHFDFSFLFVNGLDFTNQGFFGIGPLYLIQLPLFILGLLYIVRNPNFSNFKGFIFLWILLGMVPSGLTFELHSPHRSVMVFTMLNIISAVGLYWVIEYIHKWKKTYKFVIYLSLSTLFLLNIIYFIHMYTVNYPYEKSQFIQYPFKEVALYSWSRYNDFNQIIIDPQFGQSQPVIATGTHYYLGLYGNYPPLRMQEEFKDGEGIRETKFDKFSIRKVDFLVDKDLKDTLLIASSWSLPEDIKNRAEIIKTFYFYDGKEAFYAIKL